MALTLYSPSDQALASQDRTGWRKCSSKVAIYLLELINTFSQTHLQIKKCYPNGKLEAIRDGFPLVVKNISTLAVVLGSQASQFY